MLLQKMYNSETFFQTLNKIKKQDFYATPECIIQLKNAPGAVKLKKILPNQAAYHFFISSKALLPAKDMQVFTTPFLSSVAALKGFIK